eukprot:1160803-Pelagomonas_calceolata.AAC.3
MEVRQSRPGAATAGGLLLQHGLAHGVLGSILRAGCHPGRRVHQHRSSRCVGVLREVCSEPGGISVWVCTSIAAAGAWACLERCPLSRVASRCGCVPAFLQQVRGRA